MAEYEIEEIGSLSDSELLINSVKDVKELLQITMVSDSDNIILLRKTCQFMYNEIAKLRYEVERLKKARG